MEKSGTSAASLNTGLSQEVTQCADKEQDVSLTRKVAGGKKINNFQEQEDLKCNTELYSM